MRLVQMLEQRLAVEESPFQAQLLREDLVRLGKLAELAARAGDEAAFVQAGSRVGWSPGDARTAELREALEPFLRAFLAKDEARVLQAWESLHRLRMERLVGCLSAPVPRPRD